MLCMYGGFVVRVIFVFTLENTILVVIWRLLLIFICWKKVTLHGLDDVNQK
jgi:hypothetical protein